MNVPVPLLVSTVKVLSLPFALIRSGLPSTKQIFVLPSFQHDGCAHTSFKSVFPLATIQSSGYIFIPRCASRLPSLVAPVRILIIPK